MKFTATATITARRGFYISHLRAAEFFAEQLELHERLHVGAGFGDHVELCSTYGSAAITMSFASIEAAINEVEDELSLAPDLAEAIKRTSAPKRVQAVLAHYGKTRFEPDKEPYQSIVLLQTLRNGLVHPKAEWDHERDEHAKLTRKINGAGLGLSPFMPDPKFAFPNGCMSASVAQWAVAISRQYIQELRSRLMLPKTI